MLSHRDVQGVEDNAVIGNWPKVDNHKKLAEDAKAKSQLDNSSTKLVNTSSIDLKEIAPKF